MIINKILRKTADILYRVDGKLSGASSLPPTPGVIQGKRVKPWFEDNGDKTHRLNYNLNAGSLVIDLGGYEGQWSSDIYGMYNCDILIFEPYLPFAANIEQRFKLNPKIRLFKFGLGKTTESLQLAVLDNSSSIFNDSDQKATINIVSVVDFLKMENIQNVDLVKINIEGAEYELLETIIDNGLAKVFKNIQVQFHDFIIENASERMKSIQQKLSLTHQLTYQYEFVWENWALKN